MTPDQLDERFDLDIVEWNGRLHCVYLNDHRIAGGKPWGGGQTMKTFKNITIRELARAIPALRDELGLNYLGDPIQKSPKKKTPRVRTTKVGVSKQVKK